MIEKAKAKRTSPEVLDRSRVEIMQNALAMPLVFIKTEIKAWPKWWKTLTPLRKYSPAALVLLYWLCLYGLGGLRGDHWTVGLTLITLSYGGKALHQILRFLMPLFLTGIVYDSQRFYSDYIRGTVRVEEPYFFDKKFFGISTPQGVLTPNEWWQLHTHPVLDLITGFFYLAFIGIFVLFAAYFVFFVAKKGTKKHSSARLTIEAPKIMWSFFWLNVVGYTTYYWYPAAPPWYVSIYGLGPANMEAKPNPAGCLRFDEMLGTHFFTGMYGRSADVFGAIPSLHVAYPLLAVYFAYRFGTAKAFSIIFYLAMCFSAVYLNHHYILDILWGSTYALITAIIVDRYFLNGKKKRA